MEISKISKLILSVVACLSAGWIGSFFTAPSIIGWYSLINKPFFNPPNWVFAPVWTTLFILMGISLFLVWDKGLKKKKVKLGVSVFGLQLFFNVLWSIIFFGLHQILWAFAEIIILWSLILVTMIKFYKIEKKAAYLLVPYILWVSFATVLNFSIWLVNL